MIREYRIGERVVVFGGLIVIRASSPNRLTYQPQEVNGLCMPVFPETPATLETAEAEAIGRLVTGLAPLGALTIEPQEEDVVVTLESSEVDDADQYPVYTAEGDNIGHALWNLREKLKEANK